MPQNNLNQNHHHQTPRQLQGGPSFTYSDHGRGASNPRKRPADIDEIIHFVRSQGITRETTDMRLTRRAPLPGIGQAVPSNRGHNRPAHNSSSVDTDKSDGTDEGYEFDTELADYPDMHRTLDLSPGASSSQHFPNSLLSASQTNILSKSLEAQQFVALSPIKPIPSRKRVRGSLQQQHDRSPTRNPPAAAARRSVRTLPPMLQHERPIQRPTAPSPSVTPPLSRSDEEEDEEDFIEA